MEEVRSVAKLLGLPEKTGEEGGRRAVSGIWLDEFPDAPRWFVDKYFTNGMGLICGRMRVALYAKLGSLVSKGGRQLFKKNGRPQTLTTGYLARIVEEDLAAIGHPMRVHFRGYSLDPERYAMRSPWLQEEYEENERRHVPGLDPDEGAAPFNMSSPVDERLRDDVLSLMTAAIRRHSFMLYGMDEDLGYVLSLGRFGPQNANDELARIQAKYLGMMGSAACYEMTQWDDFRDMEARDVVRTYAKALRMLLGVEQGEVMPIEACRMLGDMDEGKVSELIEICEANARVHDPDPSCLEEFVAGILVNMDPSETAVTWYEDYSKGFDGNLYDDDTGDAFTGLLLTY